MQTQQKEGDRSDRQSGEREREREREREAVEQIHCEASPR